MLIGKSPLRSLIYGFPSKQNLNANNEIYWALETILTNAFHLASDIFVRIIIN